MIEYIYLLPVSTWLECPKVKLEFPSHNPPLWFYFPVGNDVLVDHRTTALILLPSLLPSPIHLPLLPPPLPSSLVQYHRLTLLATHMGEVTFLWCRGRGDATKLQYFTTLLHYEPPVVSYKPCALLHPSLKPQSYLYLNPLPRFHLVSMLLQHLTGFCLPWASREELAVVDLEIDFNFPPFYLVPLKSRAGICILTFGSKCWAYNISKRVLTVVALFLVFNIPLFENLYASFLTWRLSIIFPCLLTLSSLQGSCSFSTLECSLTYDLLMPNSCSWSLLYTVLVCQSCILCNIGWYSFVTGRETVVQYSIVLPYALSSFSSHPACFGFIMKARPKPQHTLPQERSSFIFGLLLSVLVFLLLLSYSWLSSFALLRLILIKGSYKPP